MDNYSMLCSIKFPCCKFYVAAIGTLSSNNSEVSFVIIIFNITSDAISAITNIRMFCGI